MILERIKKMKKAQNNRRELQVINDKGLNCGQGPFYFDNPYLKK
jgi:hypothetical protein